MAISNRDRIGRALDQLRDGLLPYISLQDVSVLLKLFIEHWQPVFKRLLSQAVSADIENRTRRSPRISGPFAARAWKAVCSEHLLMLPLMPWQRAWPTVSCPAFGV